ncbi:IS5/IS1182 family transposase, partial [Candidatus Woesearchaeota archaeon]|nr:IS5/IS1182 family transposase [Candidatus Woesearchaeota archaeon]
KEMNKRKVGQPFLYPESLIIFLAVLYAKGFDFRSLQGIVTALSERLSHFPIICFSQIRRRIRSLDKNFLAKGNALITGSDGTGMKVTNRGEWIREKWAIKRG